MKYIKRKILVLVFFLCLIPVYSQQFSTGAIPDPVRYRQIKTKPVLISRNYSDLPRSSSLKQYCPIPEDQSPYPSCTAWATTFAARTISESIAINRTNPLETSNNVFSPHYTFACVSKDPTYESGIFIGDALEFLKNKGAVRRVPTEKAIPLPTIAQFFYVNARHYPISDYVTLFDWADSHNGLTVEQKINPVKKSLSDKKPVIIAMKMNVSQFSYSKGPIWVSFRGQLDGYHAMCVVGYDDDIGGGAFLIQNSWGNNWANEGFIWVKYNDFAEFVFEAYEIIEDLNNFRFNTLYEANIEIEVDNDPKGMPVVFDKQGFYRTRSSYPTGTRFRFFMTNRYPAYVYAFSTDTNDSDLERIFPMEGVSPVLDYLNSTIAWPGENESMQIFGNAGTDYLVVLYSKSALDIDAIEKRFINEKGTFPERVARAVGSDFIPFNNVNYNENKIQFSTTSLNPKAVFGLLLAIEHR
jgi:hypothetical protein